MINRQKKKWLINSQREKKDLVLDLCDELGCSKTLSTLLVNRGYEDKNSALAFINKSQEVLHNPFLLNDMEKAVARILISVENQEKITIYGDYDVDGVTSVSILYLYLESLGANVEYYIPSRKGEGYGMSNDAISRLKAGNTSLIITVDTGITAINEINFANENGIDVVVTDHHECIDFLPNAVAVINPKRHDSTYPFSSLAGVGVVFKLLCAIEARKKGIKILQATKNIAQDYADLTAIGTIADVMPVTDENRIIVSYGLEKAETTKRIGLSMLINLCRNGDGKGASKPKAKKRLTSGFVGFTLAPRINAAGRINSASIAVELFLSKDEKEAERYAYELCDINRERQFTENKIADEANQIIEDRKLENKSIIILDNENWHHGVIGIVSSRVSDKYGVPSVLISFEGNEDPFADDAIGKGSGRSINGMNLVEALSSCSDLLEKFGGHELAAGLTIKRKNLSALKERLEQYASDCFKDTSREPVLEIDTELDADEITLALAKEISNLEPYGISNPTPVFATRNMTIEDIIPVGMNKHLKLILSKDGKQFSAMLFSVAPEEFWLDISDEVDVAFNLESNEFSGNITLQINVRDICLSERYLQIEKQNEELYKLIRAGECELDPQIFIPEREDFTIIYKHLLNSARCDKDKYSYLKLASDVNRYNKGIPFNYSKVKIIIKIFTELNIIGIEEIDDYSFAFKFYYTKSKTNLEKSNLLKKLKSTYSSKK